MKEFLATDAARTSVIDKGRFLCATTQGYSSKTHVKIKGK